MRYIITILFLISVKLSAQDYIETTFTKKTDLKAETIISVDNFGTTYYVHNNILHKTNKNNTITYSNLQLGELNYVNTYNSLKISLFYKYFNTLIILDNRLAEIHRIDFNQINPYKNVSHISTGHDNTIWVFNQDLQRLELFDYKTKNIRAQTVPVQSTILDLKSNYNYCWLLTEQYLYMYNYFGRLVKKVKNNNYTSMAESNDNIILKKNNLLYFLDKTNDNISLIKTPDLLINDFFVTNETLYIYNHKNIQEFNLKIN